MSPEDVVMFAADEPWALPQIECTKAASARWNVTSATKPIWIGTGRSQVVKISQPYKDGDAPVVTIKSHNISRIHALECSVFEWMQSALAGSIMNGIMMTKQTISTMIPTPGDDVVKCGLKDKEFTVFNSDGTQVSELKLREGSSYLFAIQPTSLWCFKKQIGIKWHIRQVRELPSSPSENQDWSLD